ncbi:3346_t:CDS:2 [Paraglomus occultum]|uniref:3346_t:CDS:1 n=1 Tax=Paraglomus occultum TaxID=144539 RepID=A0A9N9AV38_9GLOM|nr:3346_t:CDS:2 [Paraglomus occultum]
MTDVFGQLDSPPVYNEQNMWSRLMNAPTEWLINTLEDYEGVEWDDLSLKMSWITAGMLNSALIAIKFAYCSDQTGMGRFDDGLLWFTEAGLIAISCINALAVFMATKTYRMFNHDKDSQPISQNVRLVDKNQVNPDWTHSGLGACLALAMRYVFKSAHRHISEDAVWELSMWNPSSFTLNLFIFFSPVQALVLHGIDKDNYQYYLIVAAVVCMQVYVLINTYINHLQDKQIVFEEVSYEYNYKFVYPRIIKHNVSRQCQTEDFQTDCPEIQTTDTADTESISSDDTQSTIGTPE